MRPFLLFVPAVVCLAMAMAAAAEPRGPKFPIAKETTYVTHPLDEQGYVDYPAALDEFYGRGVTPRNNANVVLWQVIGPRKYRFPVTREHFRALGIEPLAADGDYFPSRFDLVDDVEFLYPFQEPVPWTTAEHPQIARWLKACEPHLATVAEGLKLPGYFAPTIVVRTKSVRGSLLTIEHPNQAELIEIAGAFIARAMLHLGEERSAKAWDDIESAFRLVRITARSPSRTWAGDKVVLENVATRAGATYLLHASGTYDEWIVRLRRFDELPSYLPPSELFDRYERFTYLDQLQSLDRGDASFIRGRTEPAREPDPETVARFAGLGYESALRDGVVAFDRLVAAAATTDRRKRATLLDSLTEETRRNDPEFERRRLPKLPVALITPELSTGRTIGRRLFSNSFHAAVMSLDQSDVTTQCINNFRIALALAAYRAKHGRYPANLIDLPPTPIVKIDDLFSGKPVVYRPTAESYRLYSIGPNGRDDGGLAKGDEADDVSVGMPFPTMDANR